MTSIAKTKSSVLPARRYLIYPGIQIKFALLHVLVIAAAFAGVLWMAHALNRQVVDAVIASGDALALAKVEALQSRQMQILGLVGIVSIGVMFGISILVTHRFVGPIVALIRYFETLRTKGNAQIKLRDHDAMGPLVDYLNTVKIDVSELEVKSLGEKGMTLIEVMVSVFVMSIVMLGLASNMDIYQREIAKVQTRSSRSDLSVLLRTQAKDAASLYNSAELASASALKNCLNGVGTTPCTHNYSADFVFVGAQRTEKVMSSATVQATDSSGNLLFTAPAIGGVSATACPAAGATTAYPVFYKSDGTRCDCSTASNLCPIQIYTKYTTYCSSGATCSRPSGVRVNYEVRLRPDLTAAYTGGNFKTEAGQYFFEMDDEQYYIKTTYAASTQIDADGNKIASVSYSLAEQEARQGQSLQFRKSSIVDLSFAYLSPSDVKKFQLKRFLYPTGCSSANLGTQTTVNAVAVDCRPPASTGYVYVKDVTTLAPRTGVVTTSDVLTTDQVAEYILQSLDASGTIIATSRVPLRAAYAQDGYVNVTPPAPVRFVCDPSSQYNTFKFIVNSSNSGWESLKVLIDPPLSYGGTSYPELPGSSGISKTITTTQNLVVDSKYFTPGASYTVTFQGVTGDHQTRIDRKTFSAAAKPTRVLAITSPASSSKIRTSSNLTMTSTMNLACGETPSTLKYDIIRADTSATVMAQQSILANECSVIAGASIDENKYTCTHAYPCAQWLGLAGGETCAGKFITDTNLTARAKITNPLGDLSATSTFTAGSKISLKLAPDSVKWVYLKSLAASPSVVKPPDSTYLNLQFATALISGEVATVSVKPAGGDATNFDCKVGASGNVTYNASTAVCTVKVATPASSTTFTVASVAANVEVQEPSTATIQIVGDEVLSCAAPGSGTQTCGGTKTLKRKVTLMTQLGTAAANPYDGSYISVAGTTGAGSYNLTKPDASLDFFSAYRPLAGSAAAPLTTGVEINIGLNGEDTVVSYYTPTDVAVCESTEKCAAGITVVPPSFYDSKRIFGTMGLTLKTRTPSGVVRDYTYVRECYCE